MYYDEYKTYMFNIILAGNEKGLSYLHLDTPDNKREFKISDKWIKNPSVFKEVKKQLTEYFEGKRINFDLELNLSGTTYLKKIWSELQNIPFGTLLSYKQIAEKTGNSNASRAVGMANSKNPVPLIIPCHRVVGSNGKLTGFAHGLNTKKKLINFERLMLIYNKLKENYGDLNWWPAKTDFEMMTGAVLTQNTNWENVKKALDNFKDNLNPEYILESTNDTLADIIKPSGYYNQKALRLKALTQWFHKYNFNVNNIKSKSGEKIREELLSIKGVGRETADSILVYSLNKTFFVTDTYTKRLLYRFGFDIPDNYDETRLLIEESIPKDINIYNRFHALIVEHAKHYCKKKTLCERCFLNKYCKKRDCDF